MDEAPTGSGITATQPQLFAMALNPADVVYTPDWVARDMVEYFQPTGRILEPCAGDGVFLKYLPPDAEWCEIEKGRDFFSWREPVDWIVGNPPYGVFSKWLRYSFEIADAIVYLIPSIRPWVSSSIIKSIKKYGGIREIRVYPERAFSNWSIGFVISAYHFQRGYTGDIRVTLYEES